MTPSPCWPGLPSREGLTAVVETGPDRDQEVEVAVRGCITMGTLGNPPEIKGSE